MTLCTIILTFKRELAHFVVIAYTQSQTYRSDNFNAREAVEQKKNLKESLQLFITYTPSIS